MTIVYRVRGSFAARTPVKGYFTPEHKVKPICMTLLQTGIIVFSRRIIISGFFKGKKFSAYRSLVLL
jgi:hypothetical protein